jgi:alkylhydroperoxidase family enzyme
MEARFDLMANQLGAKIAKRICNVALAIVQSPLPQSTQDLVMLRASRINGCGFCIDHHRPCAGRSVGSVRRWTGSKGRFTPTAPTPGASRSPVGGRLRRPVWIAP